MDIFKFSFATALLLAALMQIQTCARQTNLPESVNLQTQLDDECQSAKPEKGFVIPDNYPRICRRFAKLISQKHLLQKPLDESVSAQAWTNFLCQLDYDRSYFMQTDIDRFEPWRTNLITTLETGNLEFPIMVFNVFKERVHDRGTFVNDILEHGFDFSIDETYTWQRKDAPWPEDETAMDELWRRRIKNEYLARIIARDYAESNKTEIAASTNTFAEIAASTNTFAEIAASTNTFAEIAASTNTVAEIDLSPEAAIRKRYEQFNIIIQDSDAESLLQRFLSSFASAYDPHTAYMAPTTVDDFNIDMNLSLCGIGATLSSEDGTAKIMEIIPGGPAARDTREIRLRKDDKIIGVGQGDMPIEDIRHKPLPKIVQRIRGEKGTKVVLHVISASDPSGSTTRIVDIFRDEVKLEEQAATGRVLRVTCNLSATNSPYATSSATNTILRSFGYVDLPTFYGSMTSDIGDPSYRSCALDISKQIARMNPEIEGLILDLRGNGGGALREAVMLAGNFIRSGPIVIVRELRHTAVLPDTNPAIGFKKPMVVLIDRASASASEIVASALKDYGRAVIVGDHASHGKGSVQTVMPLLASDPAYGSIRLTCAKFYRINGSSTQLRGVESDIVIPSTLDALDIGEEKLPNAMPWTAIQPARYEQVYPLDKIIPTLATNAAVRLAQNQEFQKHLRIVEHFREVSRRTTVPLEYSKRYAMYENDQKISESDDVSISSDGQCDGQRENKQTDDGIGNDIVLRAATDILADLVDLQGNVAVNEPELLNPADAIFKFFR